MGGQVRDQSVDIARGIAIVAIVMGHVWRGMAAAGLVASDRAFLLFDRGLYFFHLAVFVFVAGLFVRQSLVKRGTDAYLRSRLWLFAYLYVLWAVLQGLVKIVTGSLVNNPTNLTDLLRLWIPEGQLWFLPFMIVMTLIAVIYRPWTRPYLALLFAGAASLAAWGVEGPFIGMRGLSLTVFFVAGAALGAPRFARFMQRLGPALALGAAAVLGILYALLLLGTDALAPTISGHAREVDDVSLGVLATVVSTGAALFLSRALTAVRGLAQLLAFLGRRSLEIFLAHIIATAGTRIVLVQLGVNSPALHLFMGTVVGVMAPLVLWWVTDRAGLGRWLFSTPGVATVPVDSSGGSRAATLR